MRNADERPMRKPRAHPNATRRVPACGVQTPTGPRQHAATANRPTSVCGTGTRGHKLARPNVPQDPANTMRCAAQLRTSHEVLAHVCDLMQVFRTPVPRAH